MDSKPRTWQVEESEADATPAVYPHQCFCEQLCPVLRGKLERLRLLASAFAKCEVELCSLTLTDWADTTDVAIRPLKPEATTEKKHFKKRDIKELATEIGRKNLMHITSIFLIFCETRVLYLS